MVALVLAAAAGGTRAAGPEVALVTPADGATVLTSAVLGSGPTLGWRVAWGDAPAGPPVVTTIRVATDPALTQNAAENTFTCAARSAGCPTHLRPNRVYAGRYYWRVSLSGAVNATSPTWSFVGVRQGGGAGRDRAKPRVRALAGVAQRGQTAFFSARTADDRGTVRLRATLTRDGHELARATAPFRAVTWARRQTLFSNRTLPRGLAPGAYRLCVTAWDRAGNSARGCAPYRLR
ncbi:MAG: hypothetical protein ACJ75P_00730 [Gaiellaceae bacterium]